MSWPLLQVIWQLTSDVDGRSLEAARKTRTVVERAVAKVSASCDRVPTEMAALRKDVRTATGGPLDARRLGDIEDAFARWAEAIGARRSPMHGATATLRHCDRLEQRVRAGFALWWDHTPSGKRWWVQIVVENDTPKRYWLDLGGSMWVTGLVEPIPGGMPRDERGGRRIGWGGSSFDSMYARPSTTSARRVGLTEFVYTTPGGVVYDVRAEVSLFHRGETCFLPVPRLN